MGSGASKSNEVGRLRKVELWVAALLLLLTLAAVGAVGAMLSEVVFASGEQKSSPRAVMPASGTVTVAVAAANAAPTPSAAAAPSAEPAPTPTAASVQIEQVPTAAPSATVAPAASTAPTAPTTPTPLPLPKSQSAAPLAPPVTPPRAAAVRPVSPPVTITAPSDRELAQRRCAALDSYIAELRSQAAGSAAPWVGEQLQTALARRTELGCRAAGGAAARAG